MTMTDEQAKVDFYWSSSSPSLKVKKDQQALRVLLEAKRVEYDEFDVSLDQMRKAEMVAKSGKNGLPQLFVDDQFIGVHH